MYRYKRISFFVYFISNKTIHIDRLRILYLWRLAINHPFQKVLPFVHRMSLEKDGEHRLLLIY